MLVVYISEIEKFNIIQFSKVAQKVVFYDKI